MIKQLMSQMATNMSEVSGRLRAPWGPPTTPYAPGWAPPPPQVTQVPPSYPLGCGCCTQQACPTPGTTTRYASDPNWETHAYPGDEPNPPPDEALFDSGYEQAYAYPGDEPHPPPDDAFFDSGHERDSAGPP